VLHGILLLYGSYTFWATSSAVLGASNRHRAMTWLFAGGTAVGLVLAYVLAQRFGLTGMVYGLAAADIAVAAVWVPRLACHSMGQSYFVFLLQVAARGALAALPVVAVAYAATQWLPLGTGLVRIFALAAIVGLCSVTSLFAIWLTAAERDRVTSHARRLLGR
jgi:O-antigen/teichoic acid export membrane protein